MSIARASIDKPLFTWLIILACIFGGLWGFFSLGRLEDPAFTIKQAATEVCRSEFSRYPVFGQSVDEVQGIALSRDVLKANADRSSARLTSITRPAGSRTSRR